MGVFKGVLHGENMGFLKKNADGLFLRRRVYRLKGGMKGLKENKIKSGRKSRSRE